MMLWSLEGKGLTPAAEISCPKYLTEDCPMTYLEALMPERSDLSVIAKPWLLYLREFPKEVLVPPRCFDGLNGGKTDPPW